MEALTLTDGAMEDVDHSEIRRERTFTRAPGIPRERPLPASVKRTPEPREGDDTYDDALLDYESDTYEYLQKHGAGACKPVRFVYAGQFSAPSDEEVEREWELAMAESRRWASAKGPPLQINARPRFAGLGSVEEFQPYRQPADE
jgi:hypothetical protein